MNDLGVEAYDQSCVVNEVPSIVYRLTFGYCVGVNETPSGNFSANDVALATLQWYYQLPSSYTYTCYDSLASTGFPTYDSSCEVFQNPVHGFSNCNIYFWVPNDVSMSAIASANCKGGSNPAYGPYEGGVPYC